MILHCEMQTNGLNPNSSGLQLNSLINGRLRLPPITTSYDRDGNGRFSNENSDLCTSSQDLSLPGIEIGLRHTRALTEPEKTNMPKFKELEDPTFACSRVYTVLPPIGTKLVPTAPLLERRGASTKNISAQAPNSARRNKRTTRRPRVKTQSREEAENFSNAAKSETTVDNPAIIKTPGDSEQTNESFSLVISDTALPTIAVSRVEGQAPTNSTPQNSGGKIEHSKSDSREPSSLKPYSIYTSIGVSISSEDTFSDNEQRAESPFPQFSTIPEDLRLYTDVYPASPPPHEKRTRILVEKTRQSLVEENGFRVSFMEDFGDRRRNATCAELDDALKNAEQLLREVFLKKTMEDLCMLW